MVKKVLKFGGTSVGTIERIQHVAKIIQKEHFSGNKIIVVVSAMAGKTNELINLSKEISDEDLMDLVIESGANDYTEEEDFFEVTTEPNDFNNVLEIFKKNEVKYINAQLTLRAETSVNIDHEMSEKVLNIMEFMDDLDDVQEVHTNAEFPDDFEAKA